MADIRTEASTPSVIRLSDYQPPAYLVDHVELDFTLDETETLVHSTLQCRRNDHVDDSVPLVLDGQHLQLISVALDGNPLEHTAYSVDEQSLTVPGVPGQFTLQVVTKINPQANTALEGLYLSSGILCTQCEAEGFRRISYFPDRPDVMSRFSVTLRADKQRFPVLLCNGNLVAQGDEGEQHWARWEDPSLKPSYLFALVAGPLVYREDKFTTLSGREVTLRIYVEEENIHKCDHAMMSLQQSMRWDEQTYGCEYDLDIYMIVAVNDFNMGAMENKGLNIFNSSCVLASPETATDDDYYNIQSIIGHEYFHNWSGNRVTCRDWFQLSLKEGFTVFRDQEFSADLNSRAVKRIDDVNILRTHQFAQDASPMAHPVRPDHYIEISNFYTVTVYNKGAEVVRMLSRLSGKEGFRRGTDVYFSRHDGQAVTTDDFVRCIEDANELDLSQFRHWYSQAGTPVLHISMQHDEASATCKLTIKQSCPATPGQQNKLPFYMPVEIGLIDPQGNSIALQLDSESEATGDSRTLIIDKAENSFEFINVRQEPVLSINRGFTSPVNIDYPRSDEELAFLFAHDSDEFNRWDAGQQLAMNTLLKLVEDHQQGKPLQLGEHIIDAFRKTLLHPQLDRALIAQAMVLPSESYIADQCEVVDVDAIHHAREYMRRQIALSLYNDFMQIYQQCLSKADYRFAADEMARRSLQNVALGYLMATASDEAIECCVQQFETASNMTEVLAALRLLAHHDTPCREIALQQFYEKWQHDQQVVEKWLAIQSTSPLPGTLQHILSLMQHPAFSMSNPNKVRSLIGRFAMLNMVRFHESDGSGYQFFIDQVIKLDDSNPQIAARLIQVLSRWRRFDEHRQSLIRAQLQRVKDKPGLSKDVFEIVTRSLEG